MPILFSLWLVDLLNLFLRTYDLDGKILSEGSFAELTKTGAFEQLVEECKNEQELFNQKQREIEKEGKAN